MLQANRSATKKTKEKINLNKINFKMNGSHSQVCDYSVYKAAHK
jgi:hypothetical protein